MRVEEEEVETQQLLPPLPAMPETAAQGSLVAGTCHPDRRKHAGPCIPSQRESLLESWHYGLRREALALPLASLPGQISNRDRDCSLDAEAFHGELGCWRLMGAAQYPTPCTFWAEPYPGTGGPGLAHPSTFLEPALKTCLQLALPSVGHEPTHVHMAPCVPLSCPLRDGEGAWAYSLGKFWLAPAAS